MASPAAGEPLALSARKLTELRVIDLKAQLEKRGIERTGVKASLIDRLKKALEDEGHDPEDYVFELDMKKKFENSDKEKMDGDADEDDLDDIDMEETEQDTTLTEESGTPKKANCDTLNIPSDVTTNDVEAENSIAESLDAGTDKEETDVVSLNVLEDTELLIEGEDAPSPDETVATEKETSSSTEKSPAEEEPQSQPAKSADDKPAELEPPSPSSVPVVAPFTSEDTFKMDTSSERQMDEDISLIVHVDESQMDLDNDLLTPAKKNEEKPEDQPAAEVAPGEVQAPSTEEANVSNSNAPDSTTNAKPIDAKEAAGNEEPATASEKQEDSGVKADEPKPAQNNDGDKSKSIAGKVANKDDKAKAVPASSRNLWISGLATTTKATDLKTLFSKHGKVAGAKVVTNAKSPGSRCYGFVTMSTAGEASKCIQHLHRTELHGKMISVERAKSDPSAQKTVLKAGQASQKKDEAGKEKKDVARLPRRSGGYSSDRSRSSPDKGHGPRSRSGEYRERRGPPGHRSPVHKDGAGKEVLDFDKIRAEREQERLRERERRMRVEERRRITELERMRRSQHEVERRQREEAARLEREKQKLRFEQQRLELERLEAERERIALERERQRRERERLEKEREQERQAQLRMEQERRAMKRNFDNRGGNVRDDNYWNDAKRPTMDRAANIKVKDNAGPPRNQKHEERGNQEFERRVERYDRRTNDQPPPRNNSDRYDNRREDRHDNRSRDAPPVRETRDRDDRGSHNPPERSRNTHDVGSARYEGRRDVPSQQRGHDNRGRHERDRSPHRPPPQTRTSPHRNVESRSEWKSERQSVPQRENRDRRVPPTNDRNFSDNRSSNNRDTNWHTNRGTTAAQEDRGKSHSFTTGPSSAAGGIQDHQHQWSSGDRNPPPSTQQISSRPTDRGGWPVATNQSNERVGARPQASTMAVQQPLLQTPPTSAAFLASAANIMMGVGLAGNRNTAQDTRYDAYKNLQGGNVRRY